MSGLRASGRSATKHRVWGLGFLFAEQVVQNSESENARTPLSSTHQFMHPRLFTLYVGLELEYLIRTSLCLDSRPDFQALALGLEFRV